MFVHIHLHVVNFDLYCWQLEGQTRTRVCCCCSSGDTSKTDFRVAMHQGARGSRVENAIFCFTDCACRTAHRQRATCVPGCCPSLVCWEEEEGRHRVKYLATQCHTSSSTQSVILSTWHNLLSSLLWVQARGAGTG